MRELGISPPPRPDSALDHLRQALSGPFSAYIQEIDKWFRRLRDAVPRVETYAVSLNPAVIGANSTAEQTFTVNGLNMSDIIIVNKPTHTPGIGIVNARVSAANTLAITYCNVTAGAIDPVLEIYTIVSVRR